MRHKWFFYYDGNCAFCGLVIRGLSRCDFFGRVTWIPYQTLAKPPGGLSSVDLDTAVYLDTGQDRFLVGYYAFRRLTLRLVPLLPLAPVLWFPGVNIVGVVVYRWVARNRHRLSRCQIQTHNAGR